MLNLRKYILRHSSKGTPALSGMAGRGFAVFLLVALFVFGLPRSNSGEVILSAEERAWLSQHGNEIRYAPCPNYPPYDFSSSDGKPSGLVADYISLLESRLGIKFKIVKINAWNELIEKAKRGEVDMVSSITPTEDRKKFLNFSAPIFEAQTVIVTSANSPYLKSVYDIRGKTLGAGRGFVTTELFRKQYPDIPITEFGDDEAGLLAVAFGEVDAVLTDLGCATWWIKKDQLNSLRLGSVVLYRIQNCIGVSKNMPILSGIIDKGLDSISADERAAINSRWIGHLERPPLTFSEYLEWSLPVIGPILFISSIALLWLWSLRRQVARRTVDLKQSREDLRTILNSICEAVVATDAAGVIISMNPVAETLTGESAECVVGKKFKDVFNIVDEGTRSPIDSPVRKILDSGKRVELLDDIILLAGNGTEHKVACSGTPIVKDGGEVTGAVLVFRDITDQCLLQEKIRQSEKMQAIGQLAGGMAHDFNNTLCGIIASAEVLKSRIPDEERFRKYLELIVESADRASGLTEKLLAFARKQPPASSVIDVHGPLEDTAAILKSTIDPRVNIELDLHAENSRIVGDPSQLHNAFLNLGINAYHAMPDGGRIHVSTRVVELNEAYCRSSVFDLEPGSYIEIEVRDTGCGIPAIYLSKIFEPFFTTKESDKGTGLGLSAVYGTVLQHRGAITVNSEEGSGTSFQILFPLTDKDARKKSERILQAVSGTGRILLVDDEAVMRDTAKVLLEDLGYEVILAENGKHAVDVFEKSPSSIDLVILDMVMPEMNGRDCFRVLKSIKPDQRIVLASGFADEDDLIAMKEAGLTGFIRKPFRNAALSQIVSKALSS
ncbi:MAG: transporter substrate-binding domain-containing protein [Planctomycetes bacterium]|nr:transporter substrate-binding domain-containing protein [Planctomycetota bacterium]